MNSVERRELAAAAAETFPDLSFAGLEKALTPLENAPGACAWSVGVGPQGFELTDWERDLESAGELVEALGLGTGFLSPGPAVVGLRWDAREGRALSLWLEAGGRRLERGGGAARSLSRKAHALGPKLFADPGLAARVALFHARCPVRSAVVEFEGEGKDARPTGRWSLTLEKPEPWQRFLRLDLTVPFGERSSVLSFLLLSRRVRELSFEGETPRARLSA